jgi:hypothetical protein
MQRLQHAWRFYKYLQNMILQEGYSVDIQVHRMQEYCKRNSLEVITKSHFFLVKNVSTLATVQTRSATYLQQKNQRGGKCLKTVNLSAKGLGMIRKMT